MEEISAFRRQLETHRPADWETLPDFPLYMDQVLSYMERQTIRLDESDALTASMVNNYTKNALVPRAEGKKYNRDHLAYLTFVCILKQVMSVRDMDLLIRTELSDDRSVENGYRAFLESLDGALSSTVQEMGAYEGTDNLADAAVHFYLFRQFLALDPPVPHAAVPDQLPAAKKRQWGDWSKILQVPQWSEASADLHSRCTALQP